MSASQASKSDLIKAVGEKTLWPENTSTQAVNATLEAIAKLATGQKLILRGFGTFEVKHKAARTGRNVRTGMPVEVPARDVLTFKAAKTKA